MKKAILSLAVLFMASGCERQLPVVDDLTIAGYQIQGKVTDRIGNPIPNVSVLLDYNANIIPVDSIPTRQYFVSDTSSPIYAVVTNLTNTVVMIITNPRKVSGLFQAIWNGEDSSGTTAPSGIYHVQYIVNGLVVHSYDQLVSGGRVAITDSQGRYSIPGQFLPIDSASVPYFSSFDSSYVGNLHITNDVILTFVYSSHLRQAEQALNFGLITIIDVMFD